MIEVKEKLGDIDDYDSGDAWTDWYTTKLRNPLRKMKMQFKWVDQGWGNQKGQIRLLLMRNGENIAIMDNFSGIAGHSKEKKTFTLEDTDLFSNASTGDTLKIQYKVGGGGGHELHISNCTVVFTFLSSRAKSARKLA